MTKLDVDTFLNIVFGDGIETLIEQTAEELGDVILADPQDLLDALVADGALQMKFGKKHTWYRVSTDEERVAWSEFLTAAAGWDEYAQGLDAA